MAAIEPSIALGVKPIQIENPMNQYAALSQLQANQNQNALAQYQLSAAQRADEAQNVQNQLYAKHYDAQKGQVNESAFLSDLAAQGQGSLIPKAQAQFAEQKYKENQGKKIVSEIGKLDFDLGNSVFTQAQNELKQIDPRSPNAAAQFLAYRERLYANPALKDFFAKTGMTKEATDAQIKQAIRTPQGLADTILKSMTTAEQFQKILNDREQLKVSQQNASTAAFSAATQAKSVANAANPDLQATLAGAKKTAELNATDTVSKAKTIEGANQILKDINYNAKTKTNDVSKLIDISTGSYAGKAFDFGKRIYGGSTEGSKAIAELKTIESKITTDLLGGKLGSGISNADRDFIQQQVGLIGDASLPTGDRKAAWNRVVTRLINISSEASASTSSNPNSTTVKPSLNAIFGQ